MFLSEILVWLSKNFLAVALHLSGKTSFPKPLTAEEEVVWIERLMQGDNNAKTVLVEHNLRLAAHIAKKYSLKNGDSDDLVSIGSIGLMKAVNTFRPQSGKLTAYASRCIENEILMYLRSGRKTRNNVSFADPIGKDREGNEIYLMDLLGTETDIVSREAETRIESERAVRRIASVLSPREREVIEMRYGVSGREPMHQRDVANKMGISRSYVSRIEKKALEKLRMSLENGD